ncbi:MAG TPA: hypothetical protein VFA10_17985 [Ktedonobacteraceae bacterium]|nr:hypothetical protein [Ktedonobacteraceae bacterium]
MPEYKYCILGFYGTAPCGNFPFWDGEVFTNEAAQKTVEMLEQKRLVEPNWRVETPYGMAQPICAYLLGEESGQIIWKLLPVGKEQAS